MKKLFALLCAISFFATTLLPIAMSRASAASVNLIANPSVETPDPANSNAPQYWAQGGWGTNTATLSYLTSGHTGTRSVQVTISSYTDGDAKWYFNPVTVSPNASYTFTDYYQSNISSSLVAQFDNGAGSYTYMSLATEPASAAWSQSSAVFTTPANAQHVTVFHLINAVGSLTTDDASLTATPVASSVAITSPSANANVSGTVQLGATAQSSDGIASVQFLVDGKNVGAPVTASPYQYAWSSNSVADGTHSIGATALTVSGQTLNAASVSVIVSNQNPAGGNMIPNPSVETPDPNNPKNPLDWKHSFWGTNTETFSYPTTGYAGTRSIKINMTAYTSGSAYWYTEPQLVTGGQMYDFTDYYKSSAFSTEVDDAFTMSDGSTVYGFVGTTSPSPNSWTKFRAQFTAPAGAVSVTFYHAIFSVGYLQTDNFSLAPFTYQGFKRPIVSLTFDDGYASFYNNGLPLLQKYGMTSTDYIISGYINNDPAYMTVAMLKTLNADGNEIASHTVTHPDLTTLSFAQMDGELKNSKNALQTWLNKPVTDFASPYGAYNQQVATDAQKYYATYRGVQPGFNAKNNFDAYHLQVQNLLVSTTLAQVQQWVTEAQATNTWLILVYHQVDPTLNPSTEPYNTYPSDLDAQLSYIKSTGIAVENVNQAMTELSPQL